MILVVGATGMIGGAVLALATQSRTACAATTRRSGSQYFLDLGEPPTSWRLPRSVDVAVFCASMTGLASCEDDPAKSRALNVSATSTLADLFAARGTRIVFLSSNQVFGPNASAPSENDHPDPTNEYGRQKLAVEKHLLNNIPGSQVIRLTKVISPALPLFAKWQAEITKGRPITAYSKLHFSPISLETTASMILKIANSAHTGIFHLSASDSISYLDAAKWLAKQVGADPSLVKNVPGPTSNTTDSCRLSCMRTRQLSGFVDIASETTLAETFQNLDKKQ
jgi:dTDP-4-dehydrorhamnose reductase